MKFMSIFAVVGGLVISSNLLAEGGGDKTFEKMMAANTKAMEQYAISQGKSAPVPRPYEYGMKVDVVKVISVVRPAKVCAVVPAAMTYEDSEGQLNTITYTVAGDCRKRGG
ncbi:MULTISPECIES: DUF2790 domain-containing protein [unclassified Pseudomonas]|jgi:predicted S18 family serine protease|uniref:DUF2790 domain-containing protein n=1 Tax=unclassified Pseudomonas TaxID=196821 RepID=UPI0005B45232|nr:MULTISPECIES: DUF2790 domain-containing protein [unclassified Pseudomonas]MDP9690601.1 putative S18 family serine protease [Pseudomonas mohnii]PMZ91099.1 DUF2790 domain-containing protein [Pseudomonas sp. FW215-T2]PNA15801.1 DUF2790 domain-containing protein [Pseudomonas sp. FW215-R3]PNB38400.1 DUF2790 domain-containing protein [Pseudomonas sp. FW305-131]